MSDVISTLEPSLTKKVGSIVPPEQSWVGRVPKIKQGTYSDGLPYHEVNYLGFKMMLKPNRFVSRDSLFEFAKILRKPAEKHGVGIKTKGFADTPTKIREVLFVDTPDFRLYNNAFILRRRIAYDMGFPAQDPEIVFKFRHPDIQKAAETDVRPQISGDYRLKFKCQVLPLKEKLGGIRLLYSHNVQFPRSHVKQADVFNFDVLTQIFPALESVRKEPGERINLVNDAIIEEVLQDVAQLDFGDGMVVKSDVGFWRSRGEHRPLIGEFAFQLSFENRGQLIPDALRKAEAFFLDLQFAAKDYIALNATKTGVVYRLLGNPPKSSE